MYPVGKCAREETLAIIRKEREKEKKRNSSCIALRRKVVGNEL